jgi:hypothetical protein
VPYYTSSKSQEFVRLGNMYYRQRLISVICRKRRRKKKTRFVRTVLLATIEKLHLLSVITLVAAGVQLGGLELEADQ